MIGHGCNNNGKEIVNIGVRNLSAFRTLIAQDCKDRLQQRLSGNGRCPQLHFKGGKRSGSVFGSKSSWYFKVKVILAIHFLPVRASIIAEQPISPPS